MIVISYSVPSPVLSRVTSPTPPRIVQHHAHCRTRAWLYYRCVTMECQWFGHSHGNKLHVWYLIIYSRPCLKYITFTDCQREAAIQQTVVSCRTPANVRMRMVLSNCTCFCMCVSWHLKVAPLMTSHVLENLWETAGTFRTEVEPNMWRQTSVWSVPTQSP